MRTLLGLLVACALLAGGGSPAIAGEAHSPAAPGEPGECKVDERPSPTAGSAAAMAELSRRIASEGESEDVIVLNGRGYGYASPRDPAREIELIEQELARQRAADAPR
jgi:hypothetical protein